MVERDSRPPVFYALGQLHFNPIPRISDYAPLVQDVLRREGWTEYQEETSREFQVSPGAGSEPEVRQRDRTRWIFNDTNQTQGFTLREGSLVFHTTHYEEFAPFLASMLRGLQVLHEAAELQYVSRVGLRYLNAVDPATMHDEPLERLMDAGLLGLSGVHERGLRHSFSETVADVDGGTLISRALVSPNGLSWPPDLQPSVLELQPRFNVSGRKVGILDHDFFRAFQRPHLPCDQEVIQRQIEECHEVIGRMFMDATTQKAREIWGVYE